MFATPLLILLVAAAPPPKTAKKVEPPAKVTEPPKSEPVKAPEPEPAAPIASPAPHASTPAPAAKSAKPALMILDLVAVGDVPADVAVLLTQSLATEAGKRDVFSVLSQAELTTILGVDRQKQLMGCGETACFSELAGAVGARFVLSGSIGRIGEAYQLSLQTLDTVKAQPLGRSTRIANDLKTLQAGLPWALAEATALPMPPSPSKLVPFGLVGLGAASVVGGLVLGVQSFSREEVMMTELNLSESQSGLLLKPASYYRDEAGRISGQKILAGSLLGAGVALAVLGVVLMPSEDGAPRVSLLPSHNGLALAGVW